MTQTQTDYPYIRAWGKFMGSHQYYINDEIARAKNDEAPQDAIYKRDGRWITFRQITSTTTREVIEQMIEHYR